MYSLGAFQVLLYKIRFFLQFCNKIEQQHPQLHLLY